MKESDVRSRLTEEWSKYGADPFPIENSVATGMPDLNVLYRDRDFWVEIKYREELPKLITTSALRGYLRPSQKVWMTRRLEKGASNIFLFARLEDELFLYHIDSLKALADIEDMSSQGLYNRSLWYGIMRQKPDWQHALQVMRGVVK